MFQEWSDFFTKSAPNNEIRYIHNKNTILLSEKFYHYVHDISFIGFIQRPIYYNEQNSNQTLLLIENVFFKDNTNKSDGTNIYFQNKGQCVQNKCCCISCYGGTYGIHSCIKVTQSSESKNYVFQSTFFNMNSPSYGVMHFL